MTIAPDTIVLSPSTADELEQLENDLSALAGRVEAVAMGLKRIGDTAVFEDERAEAYGQAPPEAPLLTLADVGRLYLFARYVKVNADVLGDVCEMILSHLIELDCMERERRP